MRCSSRLVLLLAAASPAVGQSQIAWSAFDNPVYEDGRSMGGPNLLLAIKTQAPAITVVTRLEVFTGERTGPNTLALWSHDPIANAPLAVLGQGGWSMSRENGWQGAMLPTPVVLTAGQDVWLVWGCQNGAQASSQGTGAGAQPYRGSFNGGASWNGPFQSVQWKFRVWTGTAGHYGAYGSGCPGARGVPELNWIGTPYVGASFDLHLARAPAGTFAILGFGDSDSQYSGTALPFPLAPLGAPGCDVLAAPLVTLFVAVDPTGRARVPAATPNAPGLVGFAIFHQWFVLDTSANALGLTVSNAGGGLVGL